ncbi:MAG TPA: glycoside hydrolase family 15 protein [Candidatus Limnocylindria bacterium]|nr:glycoside hydrolase family 15 protein [Candidatus Limnocylindria bacterium]
MAMTPGLARAISDPLVARSIEVLKAGQAPSGALVASPDFRVYRYAWLRDGAFCAHALDLVGESERARGWHRWVCRSVEAHRPLIENAIARVRRADVPPPEQMPPARYTLDGALERGSGDLEPWPNFQIDGYGMWLWSLAGHLEGKAPSDDLASTAELVASYLSSCGLVPCWNCWEEFDGGEHASTIASVAAGLRAAASLLRDDRWDDAAARFCGELDERYTVDGRFRRGAHDDRVDGSLLWLSTPFEISDSDARVATTVEAVRNELVGPGGGVYRFRGDSYYGGGQWLLLTSWLAWHDARTGDTEAARAGQAWVRAQSLANGDLPEQVAANAQEPTMVGPWADRWGAVATPLLWSHAMYLITESALPV